MEEYTHTHTAVEKKYKYKKDARVLKTTHTTHAAREKYKKIKDYSHSYAYDRTYAYTAETETVPSFLDFEFWASLHHHLVIVFVIT